MKTRTQMNAGQTAGTATPYRSFKFKVSWGGS